MAVKRKAKKLPLKIQCSHCGHRPAGTHSGNCRGYPEIHSLKCCGVGEVNGLGYLASVADVKKLFPAALQNYGQHGANGGTHKGLLFATSTDAQAKRANLLKKGGFKKLVRFKNPNTGNYVTFWWALVPGRHGHARHYGLF